MVKNLVTFGLQSESKNKAKGGQKRFNSSYRLKTASSLAKKERDSDKRCHSSKLKKCRSTSIIRKSVKKRVKKGKFGRKSTLKSIFKDKISENISDESSQYCERDQEFDKLLETRFSKVSPQTARIPRVDLVLDTDLGSLNLEPCEESVNLNHSSPSKRNRKTFKDRGDELRNEREEQTKRYLNFAPFSELLNKNEKLHKKFKPNSFRFDNKTRHSSDKKNKIFVFGKHNLEGSKFYTPRARNSGSLIDRQGESLGKRKNQIKSYLEVSSSNCQFYMNFMKNKSKKKHKELETIYLKHKKLERDSYKNMTVKQSKKTIISNLKKLKKIKKLEMERQGSALRSTDRDGTSSAMLSTRRLESKETSTVKNFRKEEKKLQVYQKRAAFFEECEEEIELVTKASKKLKKMAIKELLIQNMKHQAKATKSPFKNMKKDNLSLMMKRNLSRVKTDEDGASLVQYWMKTKKKMEEIEKFNMKAMKRCNSLFNPQKFMKDTTGKLKQLTIRRSQMKLNSTVKFHIPEVELEDDNDDRLDFLYGSGAIHKPGSREGAVLTFMKMFEADDNNLDNLDRRGLNLVYIGGFGSTVHPNLSIFDIRKFLI